MHSASYPFTKRGSIPKTGKVKAVYHIESLATVAGSVIFARIHEISTEN